MSSHNQPHFLDQSRYDDDARSLHSDHDSCSESENQALQGVEMSSEVADDDRAVLKEDEELERLISYERGRLQTIRGGDFQKLYQGGHDNSSHARIGGQESRKQRRREGKRRKAGHSRDEEKELMYEMEEGGPVHSISSESSRSSIEREKEVITSQREVGCDFDKVFHCMLTEVVEKSKFCPYLHPRCNFRLLLCSTFLGIHQFQKYSREPDSLYHFKWNIAFCPDDHPHFARWFPCRLLKPRPYSNSQFLYSPRSLS